MVCNKQYILSDADTKEYLVAGPETPVFYAGQRVYMSMLFGKSNSPYQFCPGCHANGQLESKETIWYVD
jgi:hypothetical protein